MEPNIDAALHAIWEANRLLRDEGERIAALAGQTHARRMVLQTAGQGRAVSDISRRLRLQRQSVQRIADQLNAEGLARYEENPQHRRAKLLTITPEGTKALDRITRLHREWIGHLGALTPMLPWEEMRKSLETLSHALTATASETSSTQQPSRRKAPETRHS